MPNSNYSYFCPMIRRACCFLIFFLALQTSFAQIRLSKLHLARGEHFEMKDTDIAVIDTLIMQDSSTIYLNWQKPNNFIHSKYIIIGSGCSIIGVGRDGKSGRAGDAGAAYNGPCRAGNDGGNGLPGLPGNDGIHLSLYWGKVQLKGTLTIKLTGGNGGDGGAGGPGGSGGSGTKVCAGGDGGKGGNGGDGADGGKGGNLLVQIKDGPDFRLLQNEKVFINVFGGFAGLGGDAGLRGMAGLGSLRDGKNGLPGNAGRDGKQGKEGTVIFERTQ